MSDGDARGRGCFARELRDEYWQPLGLAWAFHVGQRYEAENRRRGSIGHTQVRPAAVSTGS